MTTKSTILFPPPVLASCMSIGIERDTRAACLNDADRLNYFPSTPLVAFTVVMQGQLQVSRDVCDLETVRALAPSPPISVMPPQAKPTLSWSAGPIHAVTVGFFPDAWVRLGGEVGTGWVPPALDEAAAAFLRGTDMTANWAAFCAALEPHWAERRSKSRAQQWVGSHRIADWTRHLMTQAALSGAGRSARTLERRVKRWTGQSKQSLHGFAQLEELHSLRINDPDAALAAIAADAQFSDQSHMGRVVKKATGFSPGKLDHLIEDNEAFWCYRLLGERL